MKRTKQVSEWLSQLEGIKAGFAEMAETERDKFNEKSERYQESDKGQEKDSEITTLEEEAQNLENAMDNLNELFPED